MPAKPFEGHKKSRSPPPRYNDEDHRILEFVAAEQALIERLDKDKTRYMADSQLHPDYNKEWENFYQSKCRERGTANVDVDAINPEWVDVWKDYFYKNYERCAREERNRLMNKHKILRRTLEEFSKRHGDDPKEHWLKQKKATASQKQSKRSLSPKRSMSPSTMGLQMSSKYIEEIDLSKESDIREGVIQYQFNFGKVVYQNLNF
jgi:hypothetical protein